MKQAQAGVDRARRMGIDFHGCTFALSTGIPFIDTGRYIVKPGVAVMITLILIFVSGCSSPSSVVQEGRFGTPESDLPLQDIDLQRLVDTTPDGGTVKIPFGRYVLEKALVVARRKNLYLEFVPGTQLRAQNTSTDVIDIMDCDRICISGVRARHEKLFPEFTCSGSVVHIWNSADIYIVNCELNGCGSFGVMAQKASLHITHCYIHSNKLDAFYFVSCEAYVIANMIERNANLIRLFDSRLAMYDNLIQENGGRWEPLQNPGLLPNDKSDVQPFLYPKERPWLKDRISPWFE